MYLFLKNQYEADNRSALTQKQDWILSRTESVAHFFVMNIIISLFSGEENRFLCSLTKNVSANIKCTETPTESAVHFFFFIDQMRRR